MNIKIEYDKNIDQVFICGENKSIQINRTEEGKAREDQEEREVLE